MKKMEIKFIVGHSFVGEHMSMVVDGNDHRLDMNKTYEEHAVKILKDVYNINYNINDVKFEWDGSM